MIRLYSTLLITILMNLVSVYVNADDVSEFSKEYDQVKQDYYSSKESYETNFYVRAKAGIFLRNACYDCYYPDGKIPAQFELGHEWSRQNYAFFVEIEHESNFDRGPFSDKPNARERNTEKLNVGFELRF